MQRMPLGLRNRDRHGKKTEMRLSICMNAGTAAGLAVYWKKKEEEQKK